MIKKNYEIIILMIIIIISLRLNLYNNDFPFNYHADEPKKIEFIKNYSQDFSHPILMLQVVRILNLFFRFSENQDIVILGRITTACFGTLIVLLSYLISRGLMDKNYSLIIALAAATSPILVIHSHYLKEDIIFTCFSLMSILFLINFISHLTKPFTVLLGLSTGLALSSQYKGVLLVPVYLAVPLIISLKKDSLITFYKKILISLIISLLTFLIINYPILFDPSVFKEGVAYEGGHVLKGHYGLKIFPLPHLFSFHLLNSVIPGMTLLLTLFALYYMVYSLIKWKKTIWQEKILLFYVLLFYFSVELPPLKPFPDFMRYVIPIIPVLLYFAYGGVKLIGLYLKSMKAGFLVVLLLAATLFIPLYESIQLVYHLNKDTRALAEKWINKTSQKAKYEKYASTQHDVISLTDLNIREEQNNNVTYLVASSFMYDRFVFGGKLENQDKEVYERQKKYEMLFSYPFIEIRPAYKTFAFSNPTIRIIDISGGKTGN